MVNFYYLDFLSAINEMKNSISSSKFDIPPYIFKTYKEILWIPLQKFWTKSFNSGQIPKFYKNQIIIPKHKKGPKTNPENFRPISTTPNPIKIVERILRKKISSYLETNKLLTETQHGFRQNRSCSTQLLSYTNLILNNLTQGIETDSIYLDYSKAFDKIDHTILITKLKLLQIPDTYIKWLARVLFKGKNPNGSCRRPALFPHSCPKWRPPGDSVSTYSIQHLH